MTDKLNVNTIEPEGATTTMSVGAAGADLVITDNLKNNILKDYGYKTDAFVTVGADTWTCPTGVTSAEILIVAGGGGGGYEMGGGGGAGGVVYDTSYTVVPGVEYDLSVGAGGAGGTSNATAPSGTNSVWNVNAEGSGSTFTAIGGGGGSSRTNYPGADGGSGGGGGSGVDAGASTQQSAGTPTGGTVTSYGSAGGGDQAGYSQDAGGGGASAAGGTGVYPDGGTGGAGQLFSNFTDYGVAGYFAGGGGGGGTGGGAPRNGGAGGIGGGGDGGHRGSSTIDNGVDGTPSTGGGGGGAAYDVDGPVGGTGGSGIIMIRYNRPAPNGSILFQSNGSGVLTNLSPGFGPNVLLNQTTGSGTSAINFTTGFSSTYSEYIFEFINFNPSADESDLVWQASTDGGSNYNVPIGQTGYRAYHDEGNTSAFVSYMNTVDSNYDTSPGVYTRIAYYIGNDVDSNACGELHLYNPTSTTQWKNFWCITQGHHAGNASSRIGTGGYYATTSAINAVSFKPNSGTMDCTIKMFGVRK